MAGTKKGGTAGRFGARYGSRIRNQVSVIEEKQRQRFLCPSCFHTQVKRLASGIWQCRKCSTKFAGKAYTLE